MTALAAYEVMKGAALALGQGPHEVAYFEHSGAYRVEWPEGPSRWASAAQVQNEPPCVRIIATEFDTGLSFYARLKEPVDPSDTAICGSESRRSDGD
jgi:hypothetical protein